jgi:hypothetical protein
MRHETVFIVGQSLNRINVLLKLWRSRLRWVINLPSGNAPLKDHLKKLKLSDNDFVRKVREKKKQHVTYFDSHAVPSKRIRHLKFTLMDLGEYHDVPVKNLVRLIEHTSVTLE